VLFRRSTKVIAKNKSRGAFKQVSRAFDQTHAFVLREFSAWPIPLGIIAVILFLFKMT
tara:strand:+ start:244 stop:417 length:174 start_codon:yes stop_codon:yes gene_type:complete